MVGRSHLAEARTVIEFEVEGDPQAWQRAGRSRRGGHYTQPETRLFERRVRSLAAHAAMLSRLEKPYVGPVLLHVRAFFSALKDAVLAKGPAVLKATRPDGDNVAKAVADGLTGTAYKDDGQVSLLVVEKWHAAGDESARTEVRVAPIVPAEFRLSCPLCGARRVS